MKGYIKVLNNKKWKFLQNRTCVTLNSSEILYLFYIKKFWFFTNDVDSKVSNYETYLIKYGYVLS